jgi:hypothetical protein
VALTGVGIEFRPEGWHLRLAAEANLAFNFASADREREVEPDYRLMLGYERGWSGRLVGPIEVFALGRLTGERLFSEVDASIGYYSRYDHNAIAYVEARDGFQFQPYGTARLGPYVVVNLAKDTNRDYFNNVGEAGAGVEFRPSSDYNFAIRAEYLYGFYYGIETAQPNPHSPRYNAFRVTMRFGHRFSS